MKLRNSILCALGAATLLAAPAFAGEPINDPDTTVRAGGVVFQSAALHNTLAASSNLQIGKTVQLHCSTTAGCVVGMRFLAEVLSTADTNFFIYAKVDGHSADPTALFEAAVPANAFTEGAFDGNLMVKKGDHKIQYFISTFNSLTLEIWHQRTEMVQ